MDLNHISLKASQAVSAVLLWVSQPRWTASSRRSPAIDLISCCSLADLPSHIVLLLSHPLSLSDRADRFYSLSDRHCFRSNKQHAWFQSNDSKVTDLNTELFSLTVLTEERLSHLCKTLRNRIWHRLSVEQYESTIDCSHHNRWYQYRQQQQSKPLGSTTL